MRIKHVRNNLLRLFLSFSAVFVFNGCDDTEIYHYEDNSFLVPPLVLQTTATNVSSGVIKNLEHQSNINVNMTTIINGVEYMGKNETIECSPSDSINISYYYSIKDTTNEWSIKSISSDIIAFDWKRQNSTNNFMIEFTVPDMPTGKYPVKCNTNSELSRNDSQKGGHSVEIESLFILDLKKE